MKKYTNKILIAILATILLCIAIEAPLMVNAQKTQEKRIEELYQKKKAKKSMKEMPKQDKAEQ